MTEREFRDKLIWDGTPPSPDYPTPLIDRAVAVAKEAGAKFEPQSPDRIDTRGNEILTELEAEQGRPPGVRALTVREKLEVCRRYNDRAEVAALILEMNGVIFGLVDHAEPDLKHRVNSWLANEGSHQ